MRPLRLLLLPIVLALAAGCTLTDQESAAPPDDGTNARQFTVDVPAGATQVRVDADARAQAGEPDVTILVEDSAGSNLASDTFSVGVSTTRTVWVNVTGQPQLLVTVRVVDGDASLDVRVTAIVPDEPEIVIIRQTIVVTATPPATTTSPPATTTAPPTTTAPTEPTPPTPPTNATNNTTTNNTTVP